MKRDPLEALSLAAVIVVTASAEYELARVCGFGQYVAAAVPGALDIYAVKALRARRDVAAVVVALIVVNALSHLVSAGLLPVSVPLVVAVSAIAPLVMWRVHALRATEPVPDLADTPGYTPGYVSAPPLPAPSTRYVGAFQKAPKVGVPLDLGQGEVEGPRIRPELEGNGGSGDGAPGRDTPPEPVSDEPPPGARLPPDGPEDELTEQAREEFAELLDEGCIPSIRQLRDTYSIGQPRAQLIKRQLGSSTTR
ncbi:hypothetical protein ABZX93_14840 [Streptomyces sp. NPDC006632]|uniref:hypothetical protein n=1 Tax=Streptomyces sp. NPDC006632 TaxID=3157182 RepID=UPI0033A7DE54